MKKKITYNDTYNGFPINTNAAKQQGVDMDVMDTYMAHLDDMTGKHCKVQQVRYDLHYPKDESVTHSDKHMHDFNYNLRRKLQREEHAGGHKVDPRNIAVKEIHGNSPHPHIHGVLLVNGNCKCKYIPLLQDIEKQWSNAIGSDAPGLVQYCDKQGDNGIMIDRNKENFQEQMERCVYQASYIAKTRGKENKEKGSWSCYKTRLPKK